MSLEAAELEAARLVAPRALKAYAEGLGWKPIVAGKRRDIAVYHRPDSRLHQVIIPTDVDLADYDEAVVEAVERLAAFEHRPVGEVLEHLLLPPADVLGFREISPDAEVGSLPFDHAVQLITGTRRLLLSVAHSALVPQPYHPRLSRSEAEEFVNRCRLGQTKRGSFVLNVACPLELQLSLPGMTEEPFARRVTSLLLRSLDALAKAADAAEARSIMDLDVNPGVSANFLESLLLLRPNGERSSLTVSASWSRAYLPESSGLVQQVRLPQIAFEMAEVLAPRLRVTPKSHMSRWVGFVDALRGQPTASEPRPSGEVDFTLLDEEQGQIHARGVLNADDYATACDAHKAAGVVSFSARLLRLPRISRVDALEDFERIALEAKHPS